MTSLNFSSLAAQISYAHSIPGKCPILVSQASAQSGEANTHVTYTFYHNISRDHYVVILNYPQTQWLNANQKSTEKVIQFNISLYMDGATYTNVYTHAVKFKICSPAIMGYSSIIIVTCYEKRDLSC